MAVSFSPPLLAHCRLLHTRAQRAHSRIAYAHGFGSPPSPPVPPVHGLVSRQCCLRSVQLHLPRLCTSLDRSIARSLECRILDRSLVTTDTARAVDCLPACLRPVCVIQ